MKLSNMVSGTDLLVNAGMYAAGETASYEQLVMEDEIFRVVRRLVKGKAMF